MKHEPLKLTREEVADILDMQEMIPGCVEALCNADTVAQLCRDWLAMELAISIEDRYSTQ